MYIMSLFSELAVYIKRLGMLPVEAYCVGSGGHEMGRNEGGLLCRCGGMQWGNE